MKVHSAPGLGGRHLFPKRISMTNTRRVCKRPRNVSHSPSCAPPPSSVPVLVVAGNPTRETCNLHHNRHMADMMADMHGSDLDWHMPKCRGIDIEEASITQLQQWLDRGAFSSRELTACYLARIEKVNRRLRLAAPAHLSALFPPEPTVTRCEYPVP